MINDEQKTIDEIEDYICGNISGIHPPVDMMCLTRFLRSKIRATRAQARDEGYKAGIRNKCQLIAECKEQWLDIVISLAEKVKEDLKCIAHHGIGEEIWRIDEFTDTIRALKGREK